MSFLSVSQLNAEQIENLYSTARFFKTKEVKPKLDDKVISLLFFEPSTRTRMSFEIAALRLGARTHLLSGKAGTSLEKEESQEDTVKNVAAMRPDLLVVRCDDELNLNQLAEDCAMPIINAGWGKKEHPTQALLDILTLQDHVKDIQKEKILFVGDIKHSRVVASHIELAKTLGYEIAFCAPAEMLPPAAKVPVFENLKQGLAWATCVYSLRLQFERHEKKISFQDIIEKFQINSKVLEGWNRQGFILHPGPVNYGIELANEITKDPRNLILKQVENGVLLRMALIYHYLREMA